MALRPLSSTATSRATRTPVEFAKLTLVDGKPVYTVLKPEEVQSLLEEGKRIKNEEEAAEKAKKEAKARQRKAAQKDGADK